jgi:two-component system NtrC family response regulator
VRLRIIAATNRDLPSLIEAGGFRADLYYRLQQVAIRVPPLRERREDIYDLTKFFLERESEIHHRHITRVSEEAFRLLLRHDWPGNVRELEGEITRAVLACPIGGTIRPEHLSITAPTRPERGSLADMRASADRESVLRAITEAQGNRSLAARILRVSRKTLYALMKRHGIPL